MLVCVWTECDCCVVTVAVTAVVYLGDMASAVGKGYEVH